MDESNIVLAAGFVAFSILLVIAMFLIAYDFITGRASRANPPPGDELL